MLDEFFSDVVYCSAMKINDPEVTKKNVRYRFDIYNTPAQLIEKNI